jgi:hypothetical protein
MQIDRSDEQPEKAESQRTESWQPGSNVNCQRLLHPSKQDLAMVLSDEGRQIDSSAERPPNANSPRVESWEPGSNLTIDRLSGSSAKKQ